MSKVLVTESHLNDIADAIREKLGGSDTYKPGDMAAAIESIDSGYPEPTGTLPISANGVVNVKDYASANVNVQPNLQSKTATQNGTVTADSGYDGLSSVVVNVSGGGGGGSVIYGVEDPNTSTGANGDVYLKTLGAAIKNSSGQYINTGYHGNSNSKYVIKFMLDAEQNASYATPFGARSQLNSVTNAAYANTSFGGNRNVTYIGWGTSQPQTFNFGDATMIGKLAEMTLEAGSFKAVVDGTEYTYTFTPNNITDTTPIGIFAMLINGSVPSFGVGMKDMQLFMFDIYESGTLVHSYRPAKDSNDVVCLYDSIDQQYVYHSGGGTLQYIEEGTIAKVYLKQNGVWVNAIGAILE